MTTPATHYRPDVDGLRAFAVLSIIAYHLRAAPLPGAFVTLDIFFVISGFLIGSHVLRDVGRGRFSLGDFYLRRVRRIVPALVAMLGATAAACTMLLYPEALARFGTSLAAAAVGGANVFFWRDTDYFAPPAQTAPLLHTWSLGVEEQFYLVFPLFMLLVHRAAGGRRAAWVVVAVLLASLTAASVAALRDPTVAFYLPHLRAWEFLAGTAIAYLPARWFGRRAVREATVAGGGVLILASVALLRTTMPFPGLTAVPAVAGTMMVIAGGGHGASLGTRLLSIAPARWIGRISYSLYLWHWPLILVYKAARPAQYLSRGDKAGLFLATLAIGWLSWRWIEEPFRRTRARPAIVFVTALATSAALVGWGLALWWSAGWPSRIAPEERRLVAWERSRVHPRAPGCHVDAGDPASAFAPARCLRIDPHRANVVLMGDSHANHLWQALAAQADASVSQATAAGCLATLDNSRSAKPACRTVTRAAFAFVARAHPDLVLLAGRWSEASLPALDRTLAWFAARGQRVAVVGPIAEYDASLPILLALARHRGDPDLPRRHLVARVAGLDAEVAALAARRGVRYLSPYRAICPQPGACRPTTAAGVPLQHDYGHLTVPGADDVVRRMLGGYPLVVR